MVSRSSEASEGPPPPSKASGTPAKTRLSRLNSSPAKQDKPKDDRVVKSSAKDVAELKDYVWITAFPDSRDGSG